MFDIRLESWTKDPLETMGVLWYGTRGFMRNEQDTDVSVERLKAEIEADPKVKEDFFKRIDECLRSDMPLIKHVHFTFCCDNTPVMWREQLVRHQIGNEFWAQSSRITDLTEFEYFTPPAIEENREAKRIYENWMRVGRESYKALLRAGIKYEDAKAGMPESRLQKIYWTPSLKSLQHVISKRTCWMAQSTTWIPVIERIIEELKSKVDPLLTEYLGRPPCSIEGGYCPFELDSMNRLKGNDPLPVCPLHYAFHAEDEDVVKMDLEQGKVPSYEHRIKPEDEKLVFDMLRSYGTIWPGEYFETLKTVVAGTKFEQAVE